MQQLLELPGHVQQCREVALSLLKPSRRDLEVGLRLHEEAFVAESYGLGLHAPVCEERLLEAHAEGASALECQDLLEEMLMTGWTSSEALRREYRRAWEIAGVNCIFLNAGEEHHDPRRLLRRMSRYLYLTHAFPDFLRSVGSVAELENLGVHRGICLTLNAVPLTGTLLNPAEELSSLSMFARMGVGMMHLTYNRANLMGDGCAEARNGGLTDFGHQVIAEMNRAGVIIDLAHSGWQTTLEAARASSRPVVVSHAAAWALHRHIRCKSDEVIRAVVDTGGTIGVTNVPSFLGRTGDLLAFLDHLDYLLACFGADAVTIGMDSVYRAEGASFPHEVVRRCLGPRRRWEDFWPEGEDVFAPEWNLPRQINSLAWTNWPLITVGLVQRGHSDATIRKVLGLNVLRVAREVWGNR